jgi:hypothetical protein
MTLSGFDPATFRLVLQPTTLPRAPSNSHLRPYLRKRYCIQPMAMAALSRSQSVFAVSNTGIMGSNSALGMDVYLGPFCVSVARCRTRSCDGLIPSARSPTCYPQHSWFQIKSEGEQANGTNPSKEEEVMNIKVTSALRSLIVVLHRVVETSF